jgi:hypothetical protein
MKYVDCRERNLENMCTQEYAGLSCVRTDNQLSDFCSLWNYCYVIIVDHELTNLLVSFSVRQHF